MHLLSKGVFLNSNFEIYKHVYYDCFVFSGFAGCLFLQNYLNVYWYFDLYKSCIRFSSSFGIQQTKNVAMYARMLNSVIDNIYSGFYRNFKIVGLGYRYDIISENSLFVRLGTTHYKFLQIPFFFVVKKQKAMAFQLYGINLKDLNNTCRAINNLKLPDVYKGKGIYQSYNAFDYLKKFSKKKK